jgi:hypothetical protein
VEGKKHQSNPCENPADIAQDGSFALFEHVYANSDKNWYRRGGIERQKLNDKGCSDVSTQHHCKGRGQLHHTRCEERREHYCRRGAALQKSCHAYACQKGIKTVFKIFAEKFAYLRTESTDYSALNHVQTPEKERNIADKIENDFYSHIFLLSGALQKDFFLHLFHIFTLIFIIYNLL